MTYPQFLKILSDHREKNNFSIVGQSKFLGVSHRALYNWLKKGPHELFMLGAIAKIQQRKSKRKRSSRHTNTRHKPL